MAISGAEKVAKYSVKSRRGEVDAFIVMDVTKRNLPKPL